MSKEDELQIRRRNLPHWRLKGSAYFVTWRLRRDQARLKPDERELVSSIIKFNHNKRYQLYAYAVMDDHVHVALRPFPDDDLDKIIHTWKSYSANQLQRKFGRKGGVWVVEPWDRIIRDEAELYEKCQYILNNPFKRWPELRDYPWAGWE